MYCQQQNIIHPIINSVFISSELSTELSNSYFFYLIFCESLLQLDGVQTSFWKRRKGPSLNTTSWICLQLQSSSYCSSEDNLRHISSIFPRRSFSFTTRMYGTGLYSQQLVQLTIIGQMYKQDHILPVNPNQFSQVSKMSPPKKFFIALFVLEEFKHFETHLFLTHFGGN